MADLFDAMATEDGDLGEEIDEEELGTHHISASQAESSAPNDSDLQTTLKMMFPTFSNKEINSVALAIMMSRVFPDNFSTKIYLMVCSIVRQHEIYNQSKPVEDRGQINVIQIMMQIEALCSIGLDGKGRVEAVILHGSSRETAEMETEKRVGF